MKILLFALLLVVAGCQTLSICDYPLHESGWVSIEDPPNELLDQYNKNDYWFTNEAGDFFACPKLVREGICGNIYELYKKRTDGSYEREDIVCME